MYYIQALPRSNSKKYSKTLCELPEIADVKEYLTEHCLTVTERPYFFTHLKLSDNSIITQKFSGLTCSPTKLADALGVK